MTISTNAVTLQLIDRMSKVFRFAHTADNELWIIPECKTNKLIRATSGHVMLTILTHECLKRHFEKHVLLHSNAEKPLGNLKIKTFSDEGVKSVTCHSGIDPYQEILSCLVKVIRYGKDRVMVRSTFTNQVVLPYLKYCSKGTIKSLGRYFGVAERDLILITGESLQNVKLKSSSEEMVFDYVNHRGEKNERRVRPPFNIFFGNTEFHKEDQWLMEAWDVVKDAPRVFAMRDIKQTR